MRIESLSFSDRILLISMVLMAIALSAISLLYLYYIIESIAKLIFKAMQ